MHLTILRRLTTNPRSMSYKRNSSRPRSTLATLREQPRYSRTWLRGESASIMKMVLSLLFMVLMWSWTTSKYLSLTELNPYYTVPIFATLTCSQANKSGQCKEFINFKEGLKLNSLSNLSIFQSTAPLTKSGAVQLMTIGVEGGGQPYIQVFFS